MQIGSRRDHKELPVARIRTPRFSGIATPGIGDRVLIGIRNITNRLAGRAPKNQQREETPMERKDREWQRVLDRVRGAYEGTPNVLYRVLRDLEDKKRNWDFDDPVVGCMHHVDMYLRSEVVGFLVRFEDKPKLLDHVLYLSSLSYLFSGDELIKELSPDRIMSGEEWAQINGDMFVMLNMQCVHDMIERYWQINQAFSYRLVHLLRNAALLYKDPMLVESLANLFNGEGMLGLRGLPGDYGTEALQIFIMRCTERLDEFQMEKYETAARALAQPDVSAAIGIWNLIDEESASKIVKSLIGEAIARGEERVKRIAEILADESVAESVRRLPEDRRTEAGTLLVEIAMATTHLESVVSVAQHLN